MKLNWKRKRKRNGDEVAGPFVVKPEGAKGYQSLFVGGYWSGMFDNRIYAKRAAQRIADKILRNVGVKP